MSYSYIQLSAVISTWNIFFTVPIKVTTTEFSLLVMVLQYIPYFSS